MRCTASLEIIWIFPGTGMIRLKAKVFPSLDRLVDDIPFKQVNIIQVPKMIRLARGPVGRILNISLKYSWGNRTAKITKRMGKIQSSPMVWKINVELEKST